MPVFLIHGFRWPRPLIRIHIILQNLDDAAAEWLVAPDTTTVLLENFQDLYPDAMKDVPALRFVEQYDPDDMSANAASQPYAYVADLVEEISLSVDLDEVRGRDIKDDQRIAINALRDNLAPGEKVTWYVVVCGDEERFVPLDEDELEESVTHDTGENSVTASTNTDCISHGNQPESIEITSQPARKSKSKGLSKFFSSYKASKLSGKKSIPSSKPGD